MQVLFALQTAFSLWMLVDAIKRRAEMWWYLVVMMPFGEWAYFFAVYLPANRHGHQLRKKLFTRPTSVAQLRRELRQTPSHVNRVRLAQGLHDAGTYTEAAELFAEVVRAHPQDKDALYGYARCAFEANEDIAGLEALERLVELDIAYDDFDACGELARRYWSDGRQDHAIALLRRAQKKTQRIGPHYSLASCLAATNRTDEARQILTDALDTYDSSPRFVRARDRDGARAARALLKTL